MLCLLWEACPMLQSIFGGCWTAVSALWRAWRSGPLLLGVWAWRTGTLPFGGLGEAPLALGGLHDAVLTLGGLQDGGVIGGDGHAL